MRSLLAGQNWNTDTHRRTFMQRGSCGYIASCMPPDVQEDVLWVLNELLAVIFEAWRDNEASLFAIISLNGKGENHYAHGVACAMSVYAQLVLEKDVQSQHELENLVRTVKRDLLARETSMLDVVAEKANAYFSLTS